MSSSCDDSGEDNYCHSEGAVPVAHNERYERGWAVAPARALLRDEVEISVLKSRLDAAAAKNVKCAPSATPLCLDGLRLLSTNTLLA